MSSRFRLSLACGASRPSISAAQQRRKGLFRSPAADRMCSILCAGATLLAALSVPRIGGAVDPLGIVRAFCRADGDGARLTPQSWNEEVAPFVAWALEPAWDQVVLLAGYEIRTPRRSEGGLSVDVEYTTTAVVRPGRVERSRRVALLTLDLQYNADGGWKIEGPPIPPHVFETAVDPHSLAQLLSEGTHGYRSASAFAWSIARERDPGLEYSDVRGLPGSPGLARVAAGQLGDLAVFYRGEAPYHVGVIVEESVLLSQTINGGLQRSPFSAFAGNLQYFRLRAAEDRASALLLPADGESRVRPLDSGIEDSVEDDVQPADTPRGAP